MSKKFNGKCVVKSKCVYGNIYTNSAAILEDTDPYQSLQYLIEIFKNINQEVVKMIYIEASLNMDQALDTLMTLTNEENLQQVNEKSVIKENIEDENNNMNSLQISLTENKTSQKLVNDTLKKYENMADQSSEKCTKKSDCYLDHSLLSNNLMKSTPQFQNINSTLYDHGFQVNDKKFNTSDLNSLYHYPREVSSAIASNWNNSDEIKRVVEKVESNHRVLIILRGLPGSGKSTLARKLKVNGIVCSTDDFFYQKGKYIFDCTKLNDAHYWNQNRAIEALLNDITPVIIDNTNIESWEMAPYITMGKKYNYDLVILEPNTPWKFKVRELAYKNKHNVPKEKISKMLMKYQHNITVSSFDKISSSACADSLTSCLTDSTSVKNEENKKAHVSLEAIVHREELSTDCLLEKDCNNSHNVTVVPRLFLSKNLPAASNETEIQSDCITENAFEKDNFIEKNSSIHNLEELKTLIQGDSEDSQSIDSKKDAEISNQDVSSWEEITEHDDDFLWKTAPSHDIVSSLLHDTLLQNEDNSSDASKIIDFACKPIGMLQSCSDVSFEHETEIEESYNLNVHMASGINTLASKPGKNSLNCSEDSLLGNKEHICLKNCSNAGVNFEIDTNIKKGNYIIYPVTCLDDSKVNVLSGKKVIPNGNDCGVLINEREINLSDLENNHLVNVGNSKCESDSMCRNFVKKNEIERSAKSFDESFIFKKSEDKGVKNAHLLDSKFSFASLDNKLNMIGNYDKKRPECIKSVSYKEKLFIENDVGLEFIPRRELKIDSELGNVSSWNKDVDYSNESNSVMTSLNQRVPINENKNYILQEQTKVNDKQCLLDSINPKPQRKENKIIVSKNVIKNKSFSTISTDSCLKIEECEKWANDDNVEEKNDCSDVIDMKNFSIPKSPRNLSRSVFLDKNNSEESGSKSNFPDEQSVKSENKKRKQRNPLLKKEHLFIEKEWKFPQYVPSDMLKNDTCDSTKNVSYSTKNVSYSTSSSQTDPTYFILLNKIERNESFSAEHSILISSGNEQGKKGTFNFQHSEQDLKYTSRVLSFDKSTCTEELGINIDKSEKLFHLQECFPDIWVDDLIHLLEVCLDDETLLTNLLLDAGYNYNKPNPERHNAHCLNNFTDLELKSDFNFFKMGNNIKMKKNETSLEIEDVSENIKTLETDSVSNENQSKNFLDCNAKTIQTLQFTLDPAFALQLEELFGPVVCEDSDSVSACPEFEIDLEFAKLIHNKWKTYVQNKSKVNDGNVKHKNKEQDCKENNTSSDKKNKKCTNLISSKRNDGEPMSLTEIMDMEYALQIHKNEKLKKDADIATKIKRLKLYDMFPGADPVVLDDIFESNNHCLESCIATIDEDFGGHNLKQAKPSKKLEKCADEWSKKNIYKEFENNDWRSWVYTEENEQEKDTTVPKLSTISLEARKFREVAADNYVHRQNCFQKAQNYYCRGMKSAASYYAQEGSDYSYKFKKANKDAADLICNERNASLPPFVLDLHGLYVQEAIPALEKFLKDKKLEIQSKYLNALVKLHVITGRGLHSAQGPKLRPSVIEFLKKNGYYYCDVDLGTVEVILNGDGSHEFTSAPKESFMAQVEF